ncbi:hypothetical protein CYMTET_41189, partial [Cymbomonas tetramitiformis]
MAEIGKTLKFSLGKFPVTSILKDECGLPFGCVVQPFIKTDKAPADASELPSVERVLRCNECFGYTNPYCQFNRYGWTCCLCEGYNEYPSKSPYAKNTTRRALPEMSDHLVEFEVDRQELGEKSDDLGQLLQRPVTIALVDLSGGEEFLELVKSALLAALEALPSVTLFGLVTFSHKLGLYDVQGSIPVVKSVPIPTSSTRPEDLVELAEAMSLDRLVAPLDKFKEQIAAAVETLRPASSWEYPIVPGEKSGAEQAESGMRNFGGAMDALLDFVGACGVVSMDPAGNRPAVLSAPGGELSFAEEPLRGGLLTSASAAGGRRKGAEERNDVYASTTMLPFLAGRPDCGPGALTPKAAPEVTPCTERPSHRPLQVAQAALLQLRVAAERGAGCAELRVAAERG